MITLQNLTLRRGTSVLLDKANLQLTSGQRVGIIGANGAGKSSLFALLRGEISVDGGDLRLAKNLKLAHLAQETPGLNISAHEYVLAGDDELATINQQLNDPQLDEARIAHLHAELTRIDGYTAPARAAQLLSGLGFAAETHSQAVKSFSGGWRVRLNLARALISRSDLLLLDEPTNHLDLDTIVWLEQWLKSYPGTMLIISHDRDFLDKTVQHIVHFDQQQLTLYSGNYSAFEKLRAIKILQQQAAFEKQQQQLAHLQSFVDRFRAKATKARQAQSRLKAIERMETVYAVQTTSPFQFQFASSGICPNPLITVNQASIAYADHLILQQINFTITAKARIAVLGPNGAGKSSLIKLLAGKLAPQQGEVQQAAGVKIGYFAQHQIDQLDLTSTPFAELQTLAKQATETQLRSYLGGFGFCGDEAFATISNFSGGEKTRLALALLIWQKPNLLLLDEPTNHLDLEMRQALSLALQDYDGAMLLVSHDRFLVRTTTDELYLVADQKVQPYSGDLDDYEVWLQNYRKQQHNPSDKANDNSKKRLRQQAAGQREALKPLMQKIKQLETAAQRYEDELNSINQQLTDTELYNTSAKDSLQQLLREQARIKTLLIDTETAWLQALEEKEKLS